MPPPPRPPVTSRDAIVDLAERQTPRAIYVVSLLTAVAAFSLAVMRLPDPPPAGSVTTSSLYEVSDALSRYSEERGSLPTALDDLLDGWLDDADRLHDAWGRPILYARTGDGDAVLVSLGADAHEGGEGDDRDVVVRVPVPLRRPSAGEPPR